MCSDFGCSDRLQALQKEHGGKPALADLVRYVPFALRKAHGRELFGQFPITMFEGWWRQGSLGRDPRSLTEGMISSAIQRRAVRIDTPVSRAMSRARRYPLCPVISASPGVGALVWRHARDAAQPMRGRFAEPKGARVRPGRHRDSAPKGSLPDRRCDSSLRCLAMLPP